MTPQEIEDMLRQRKEQEDRQRCEPAGQSEPPEPVLVRLADVKPEPVSWLWHNWMPQGTLVVLDGDPGLGKSTLTLDLAARITRGNAMPPLDGKDLGRGPRGVLLLGAEDTLNHTVRPRLDQAGADVNLVHSFEAVRRGTVERPPSLPADLELIEARAAELALGLVVVDPLMAFLGGEYDAHKDQDIRRCLRPMAKLAERLRIVVLLLRHLNKLSGGPALYRGGSSIGITGAARASLIVGRDPDDDEVHVLAMNKCNLGPKPASLAYRIETAGGVSRIIWEGETDLKAHDILGHGTPRRASREPGRPDEQLAEARRFLADLLSGGPVSAAEVRGRADRNDIAWRTLLRAKTDMNVRSFRDGPGWAWSLPGNQGCQNPDKVPGRGRNGHCGNLAQSDVSEGDEGYSPFDS